MKILQVIGVVAKSYGGPSIGSVEANKALRELGVDARILTTRLNNDGPPLTDTEIRELQDERALVQAYPSSWPRSFQNSWKLAHAIFLESRQTDLIHIHGQYLLPHVFAYLAARHRRISYGVQPHGGLEPYQRAQSRTRKKIYGRLIGDRIIRNASYVQFASQSEADHASDVVRGDQIRIAPLGAALPDPTPIADVSEWLGNTPRTQTVLFLGRLARKKRPDLLIEAWAKSQLGAARARLIVAGPDDSITRAELEEHCRALGILDQVYFTGSVDAGQKAWLFEQSGIFVLPSENENFGITVAEAMLSGCYTIVTKEVASGLYVVESGGGMVLDQVGQLGEAIGTALASPLHVKSAGEQAREFAATNLTWASFARAIRSQISTEEKRT